jgi:hypothetical protein
MDSPAFKTGIFTCSVENSQFMSATKDISGHHQLCATTYVARDKRKSIKFEACFPTTEKFFHVGEKAEGRLVSVFGSLFEEMHNHGRQRFGDIAGTTGWFLWVDGDVKVDQLHCCCCPEDGSATCQMVKDASEAVEICY